jgi:uncharacterized protein (TIGR02284 family)
MSKDKRVTKDLIQTLEDGRNGFEQAADHLADSDRPDLVATMRRYADQRAQFAQELETLAARYGDDDVDSDGSMAAAAHRGWMSLKDAISGSDGSGVLDVAEQGEDHAVAEYRKALDEDISAELRAVIQRQLTDVQAAHDDIRSRRDAVS